MTDEPHEHGWKAHLSLAHAAPRCGAKNRAGGSCRAPAMANGRCRSHGGKSTGPITCEGLERPRKANWQHGHYSAQAKAERAEARLTMRTLRWLLRSEFGASA